TRQSGSPSSPIAPTAMGSGLIVDSEGHIVTNNHVVQNQTSLQVIFSDGKKAPARLVGTDAVSDLAVIKVDAAVPAVAVFGDSDKLELGQPVVAIGSALGNFRNTVTAGVVSGLNRNLDDPSAPALRNLIQTDAAINHGNSGGPLIDLNGRVVGINVAVVRTTTGTLGDVAEGLGFAIPANSVQTVSAQLIKSGVVSRPFVGISYQLITPQIAAYYDLPRNDGILVTDVQAGSPAAKAGLTANSIITKFDGVTLNSDTSMLELLMKHKIGDNVSLTYLPSGASAEKTVMVVLAERPNGQ
ncbi:MAG TPA: trypsin-like peptidase domain-containing protein, partial [Chloroflexota bacterium]